MAKTLLDQLVSFLESRPNEWIGAREFEPFGRQAWRTRLSDARTQRGMTIENRVRIVRSNKPLFELQGCPRTYKVSEYRYVTRTAAQPADTDDRDSACIPSPDEYHLA